MAPYYLLIHFLSIRYNCIIKSMDKMLFSNANVMCYTVTPSLVKVYKTQCYFYLFSNYY